MLIDSGLSINVIGEKAYDAITKSPENKQLSLHPTYTKIYGYGSSTSLPVLETFSTRVESKTRTTLATIYVIQGENGCLLSFNNATELELVSVIAPPNVNISTQPSVVSSEQLRAEYPDVFDGIGKMKDFQVRFRLHIDPSDPLSPNHIAAFRFTYAKSSTPN